MAFLSLKDLRYTYPDGTPALRGVTFDLAREKTALIGPNGSGKSTLLAHLAGALDVPDGRVFLDDSPADREMLRRSVGLVFQDPDDQLFMATVREDVGFTLVARGMSRSDADRKAEDTLQALGGLHLADRPPHRLSGGEKRLVALAGVMAADPKLLVLDEPSSALDPKARRRLINVLAELDRPFLMTTHDLEMARELCSRVLVLREGQLVGQGGPELLLDEEKLTSWDLEPLPHP